MLPCSHWHRPAMHSHTMLHGNAAVQPGMRVGTKSAADEDSLITLRAVMVLIRHDVACLYVPWHHGMHVELLLELHRQSAAAFHVRVMKRCSTAGV